MNYKDAKISRYADYELLGNPDRFLLAMRCSYMATCIRSNIFPILDATYCTCTTGCKSPKVKVPSTIPLSYYMYMYNKTILDEGVSLGK